jgi:hypothetical protein
MCVHKIVLYTQQKGGTFTLFLEETRDKENESVLMVLYNIPTQFFEIKEETSSCLPAVSKMVLE